MLGIENRRGGNHGRRRARIGSVSPAYSLNERRAEMLFASCIGRSVRPRGATNHASQAIKGGVVGFLEAMDQSLSGELVTVVTYLPWCRSCHHVSELSCIAVACHHVSGLSHIAVACRSCHHVGDLSCMAVACHHMSGIQCILQLAFARICSYIATVTCLSCRAIIRSCCAPSREWAILTPSVSSYKLLRVVLAITRAASMTPTKPFRTSHDNPCHHVSYTHSSGIASHVPGTSSLCPRRYTFCKRRLLLSDREDGGSGTSLRMYICATILNFLSFLWRCRRFPFTGTVA